MTLNSFNQLPNGAIGPLALPLSVEGVDDSDPAGHVSREILLKGTRIVIPYWVEPEVDDELWVLLFQNGNEQKLYKSFISPPQAPFLYFDLTPQHLATDGIAFVYYKIWKGSGGTDDPSPERQLTIDHTPLLELSEPWFRHATFWGYLNNNTKPPLTSGATVVIPAFTNVAVPGDVAKVHWRGYSSVNGSGPEVPGTYGFWDKPLSAVDIANGFDHVVPYQPHIRQLFDNDSAIVICQLFRGGRLIAESKKSLVRIDQVTPGESGPSGLNQGERKMTVQQKVTFKARANPPQFGASINGIFATAISVDTITDDFIPKSQLDTGKVIIKLAAFAEPLDGDDCDIWAAVEGQTLVQIVSAVPLGPKDGRPDPFLIELDKAIFPDLPQPAGPTAYKVQVFVYRGGAGNDDPSNEVRLVIDENPPFGLKFPTKRLTPPTPAPIFTNAPIDPQRTVNEAWMQLPENANAALDIGIGYVNRRPDDELELHLVSGGVDIEAFKGTVSAGGVVSVPNTELRKLPNGRVMVHFFWTDHVGNRSARSTPAPLLTLGLALDPVLRKAPLVPATDPDATTTIYLDNFLATGNIQAIVERAFIDNLEPGDEVMIYVEDASEPTNFKELGPFPIANVDVPFTLDYKGFFEDLFGTYEEATEFKIWSEVVRGGSTFASPELFFWANLFPSGGVFPELPSDVNPAFVLPVVTGASNTPNELQPGDRDKPGKIEVTLGIIDPPLNSTETAKFYLNDKHVGDVSPFSDMTTFSHVITAADIAALPTPSVLAYWTRQKTGLDKNAIKSRPQTVQVSGRKIDLLPPTIRIRNPLRDQMDCFAMNNAMTDWKVAIGIPKDAVNLPPGTGITVHFEAYSDAAGTTVIPGTDDSQPYTIQPPGTPDVAGVASAVIFKLAQPRRNAAAWAKYWYTANIGGVQTSIPIIKKLDTITSSAEYCDRTSVPA